MTHDSFDRLTENQKVVLRLVADGFETGEIAQRLGLTESAVIDRVERARSKFDGMTRKRLARLLMEAERLIPPSQLEGAPTPLGGREMTDFGQIPGAVTVGGVREVQAVFTHDRGLRRIARLGVLARSGLIVASALALLVVIALIKPAWDGLDWIGTAAMHLFQGKEDK